MWRGGILGFGRVGLSILNLDSRRMLVHGYGVEWSRIEWNKVRNGGVVWKSVRERMSSSVLFFGLIHS